MSASGAPKPPREQRLMPADVLQDGCTMLANVGSAIRETDRSVQVVRHEDGRVWLGIFEANEFMRLMTGETQMGCLMSPEGRKAVALALLDGLEAEGDA